MQKWVAGMAGLSVLCIAAGAAITREEFDALEKRVKQLEAKVKPFEQPNTAKPEGEKAEPPAVEPPKGEESETTVYVTKSGQKYHRAGCSFLSKSKAPIPLEEAKKKYSPCSVCHPPE